MTSLGSWVQVEALKLAGYGEAVLRLLEVAVFGIHPTYVRHVLSPPPSLIPTPPPPPAFMAVRH